MYLVYILFLYGKHTYHLPATATKRTGYVAGNVYAMI